MAFGGARTVLFLIFLSLPTSAAAQTPHSSIRGRISNAAGIVPGADVELRDERTGVSTTTTSNSAGEYLLPNVPPGVYDVRVSAPGYKVLDRRHVLVGTHASITLDLTLEPGPITEHVVVNATAADRLNGVLGTA